MIKYDYSDDKSPIILQNETRSHDNIYCITENENERDDTVESSVISNHVETALDENSAIAREEGGALNDDKDQITLSIKNGNFTWNRITTEPQLKNITLSAKKGDLIIVIGQVGKLHYSLFL